MSERIRYWRRRMSEFASNGLSRAAFCRQRRLNDHTMTYWVNRLAKLEGLGADGEPTSFVEVSLPVEVEPSLGRGRPTSYEALLGNGRSIRLGAAFAKSAYKVGQSRPGGPGGAIPQGHPTLFRPWSVEVLPRSAVGKAVGYLLNQWHPLTRFLDDPTLPLHNNASERAMRHVVIGRKNWMFSGSADGGHRAAIIYSIVMTGQLHGLDPFAYLRDIIDRLPRGEDPALLLPAAWKAEQLTPTHCNA